MCWTRWKHQILMNWLSLYLFRPPVLQLINYLWAFSLQNLPQIWSKFWWSISMMLIYIMEKNPCVNLSWSWIISNSIFMLPKGYWYLKKEFTYIKLVVDFFFLFLWKYGYVFTKVPCLRQGSKKSKNRSLANGRGAKMQKCSAQCWIWVI